MGFTLGAKTTADIVQEIAEGLIATPEGFWSDADPTWTTIDRTGNLARRVLKYVNGAELIYLALEVINQTSGMNYYYGNQGWWYYGKGIRVVFSASWDYIAHIYPTSNQSTFVPFETKRDSVNADFRTLMIPYQLWIETNGFVIMGKPEPDAIDTNQQSFIIVVERSPTKEYADGYTNFFCFASVNIWGNCLYDGNWAPTIWRNRTILRPFAFQYPDHGSWGAIGANGAGVSFVPTPSYQAFKSVGNNKVYYVKPLIHNVSGQTAPVFQSDLFFMWSEGVGLIDGDVISIEGRTTKYLCKGLDSPDSTSRLTYAMKYIP